MYKKQKQLLIQLLKQQGIKDKKVMEAIGKIPRHLFVEKQFQKVAYENYPIPILGQQTISQPYTVALMLEALELKKGDKVLEIGTGSAYNAALIQYITKSKVYTIEILPKLIKFAKNNLKKAKIKSIQIIKKDGSTGYKLQAPYDKIILAAAAPKIPKPLINQLKENGIIVAPIGYRLSQTMLKIKKSNNKLKIKQLGSFLFVPLKGKYGY